MTLPRILGSALLIGFIAIGSWLLAGQIRSVDAVHSHMVRDAEAKAGYTVFLPDVPEGFFRTGGIRVDPPPSPGLSSRVVQVWNSRQPNGIYFIITQGPEQPRPPGGQPFTINGVMGERLVLEPAKPRAQGTLMMFWRQGDRTYTMFGVADPPAEAAMLQVAGFLQRQDPSRTQ